MFTSQFPIDGSYVTTKAEPNDIDLILVLHRDVDSEQHELIPAEYNVRSKRMVRKKYVFDVLTVVPNSPEYAEYLEFFARVRRDDPELKTNRVRKGALRIDI